MLPTLDSVFYGKKVTMFQTEFFFLYLHGKFMDPVTNPHRMGVAIYKTWIEDK